MTRSRASAHAPTSKQKRSSDNDELRHSPLEPSPTVTTKRRKGQSAQTASATSPRTSREVASHEPWYVSGFTRGDEEYDAYMATEWGVPKHGERELFEKMCLESAQAGLSWLTILRKREAYRAAFHGFDVDLVAAMTDKEAEALLAQGPGAPSGREAIVRNRAKVFSVINNARAVQTLRTDWTIQEPRSLCALDDFLWSFVGHKPHVTRVKSFTTMPASSPAAEQMSKDLKQRGFKFVGPTMCYSLMQSCGLVIDHPVGTPEFEEAVRRAAAMHQQSAGP